MRIRALRMLLPVSAFAFALGLAGLPPVQAQTTPVQAEKTPQQSEQSREQDRTRAEDVKVGRDWKARESENTSAAPASDKTRETVGRDWRAHPEKRDR